jgi:hypothetical protein
MAMTDSEKAIKAWTETHLYNPKFNPLFGSFHNGLPIVCFYEHGSEYPYSVQYAGNGHYFRTETEMEHWYFERRSKK